MQFDHTVPTVMSLLLFLLQQTQGDTAVTARRYVIDTLKANCSIRKKEDL
jgi:hypothetical protein